MAMIRKTKKLDLGKRIVASRVQRGLSQGIVARRAGVDPSYLSRIETGKVHPTVRTALKISNALRISLADLLGPTPPTIKDQPCPVSASGRCLLDLIDVGPETRRTSGESYSKRQLRLLRRFSLLLHKGNPKTLGAIEVLIKELVESSTPRRRAATR